MQRREGRDEGGEKRSNEGRKDDEGRWAGVREGVGNGITFPAIINLRFTLLVHFLK